jgi:hypothetical protein
LGNTHRVSVTKSLALSFVPMDTAKSETSCFSSTGRISRRSCMANSQQKNHPNERMKYTTAVFLVPDDMASSKWSRNSTALPSDARTTLTPVKASNGSLGASAGGADREEVLGAAADEVTRDEARGLGLGSGVGSGGSATGFRRNERVTRAVGDEMAMIEGCARKDENREGQRVPEKQTHPTKRGRSAAGRATRARIAAAMALGVVAGKTGDGPLQVVSKIAGPGDFYLIKFHHLRSSLLAHSRAPFASTRFGSNTPQRFRRHTAVPASLRI